MVNGVQEGAPKGALFAYQNPVFPQLVGRIMAAASFGSLPHLTPVSFCKPLDPSITRLLQKGWVF